LLGYVCTTPKARAEIPLVSDKGDPVLAHWQYGLGRAVAFTSDAKSRWAKNWLGWDRYRQFWSQIAQWSLRRLENADFTTEVSVDKGEAHISVKRSIRRASTRNFLSLQSVVVSPKGERETIRLEQTGPGHYEAHFPTKEVGSYLLNVSGSQRWQGPRFAGSGRKRELFAEFSATEPNLNLLKRLADTTGGKLLDPLSLKDNPFLHNRQRTFQPRDIWEWLLKLAVILFVLDVGIRRIPVGSRRVAKSYRDTAPMGFVLAAAPRPVEADESLGACWRGANRSAPNKLLQLFSRVRSCSAANAGGASTSRESGNTGAATPAGTTEAEPPKPTKPGEPTSTTSRLLEAKRRARKKID